MVGSATGVIDPNNVAADGYLDWPEDDTQNCSLQLVDGERRLFQPSAVAAHPLRLDIFNPPREALMLSVARTGNASDCPFVDFGHPVI
jgi:hypothetical protein